MNTGMSGLYSSTSSVACSLRSYRLLASMSGDLSNGIEFRIYDWHILESDGRARYIYIDRSR